MQVLHCKLSRVDQLSKFARQKTCVYPKATAEVSMERLVCKIHTPSGRQHTLPGMMCVKAGTLRSGLGGQLHCSSWGSSKATKSTSGTVLRDPTRVNLGGLWSLTHLELRSCDLSTSVVAGLEALQGTITHISCSDSLEKLQHLLAPSARTGANHALHSQAERQ